MFGHIRNQTTGVDDALQTFRIGIEVERLVTDRHCSGCHIDGKFTSVSDGVYRLGADDSQQTGIDAVAKEYPGEGLGDHRLDPRTDRTGSRLLARTATTEVAAGHDDLGTAQLSLNLRSEGFESVFRQFHRVDAD